MSSVRCGNCCQCCFLGAPCRRPTLTSSCVIATKHCMPLDACPHAAPRRGLRDSAVAPPSGEAAVGCLHCKMGLEGTPLLLSGVMSGWGCGDEGQKQGHHHYPSQRPGSPAQSPKVLCHSPCGAHPHNACVIKAAVSDSTAPGGAPSAPAWHGSCSTCTTATLPPCPAAPLPRMGAGIALP